MNFRVEKSVEKDVPQIIEMLREFAEFENLSEFCKITEEILRDSMFGARSCVEGLTAFDGDAPIGYALFYENFASFRGQRGIYLEDIYIRPNNRGRGVGEIMLKHLAQIGKIRGCQRIDFQVLEWNEPAVKFYEKLGAQMDADERHFRFVDEAFEELSK